MDFCIVLPRDAIEGGRLGERKELISMEYRAMGDSELKVSVTGLGGNTFGPPRLDEEMSIKCIHEALDLGINFVDTSLKYGQGQSEIFLGKALEGRHGEMLIATKYNLRHAVAGSVAAHITKQCDESLRKLKADHIDLYQGGISPDIALEELLAALDKLIQEGKVRYIGAMNSASWRLAQAIDTAHVAGLPAFVSNQHNYNMVRRHVELEVLPMCDAYNVGFLPNATLAGGYLTDKYSKGQDAPAGTRGAAGSPMVARTRTSEHEDIHDALKGWAHDHGHTLGELALAWISSRPEVSSVLTGVSSPQQVQDNVRAGEWKLTREETGEVNKLASWEGDFERIEGSIRQPGEG
jgi:aryl-alcohol dehydrogenase-like predicted oxidoreductase